MKFQAVLFDLGGTLLHYHDPLSAEQRHFRRVTLEGVRRVYERLVAEGETLPPPDQFQALVDQHIGRAYLESVQNLRGGSIETPICEALIEIGVRLEDGRWANLRPHFYAEIDRIVSPRLGVRETLARLHEAGYRLGIISNTYWAADVHDRHLAEHGILEFLPLRIYSSDTPHIKPHPSIFIAAADSLGISPAEAVYVGDRPDVDIVGAQGAGLRGVLIRSPYLDQSLGPVTPDAIIDELPDLIMALERL